MLGSHLRPQPQLRLLLQQRRQPRHRSKLDLNHQIGWYILACWTLHQTDALQDSWRNFTTISYCIPHSSHRMNLTGGWMAKLGLLLNCIVAQFRFQNTPITPHKASVTMKILHWPNAVSHPQAQLSSWGFYLQGSSSGRYCIINWRQKLGRINFIEFQFRQCVIPLWNLLGTFESNNDPLLCSRPHPCNSRVFRFRRASHLQQISNRTVATHTRISLEVFLSHQWGFSTYQQCIQLPTYVHNRSFSCLHRANWIFGVELTTHSLGACWQKDAVWSQSGT